MAGTVLVTGGFGLVGSATVRRLAGLGRRVVAADLDTPANRKAAEKLPTGVEFRWADLTDPDQVQQLVSDIAPVAIIHLAAIIVSLVRTGHVEPWLFANHPMFNPPAPAGYTWSLGLLYLVWAIVIVVLYFACSWYLGLRKRRATA